MPVQNHTERVKVTFNKSYFFKTVFNCFLLRLCYLIEICVYKQHFNEKKSINNRIFMILKDHYLLKLRIKVMGCFRNNFDRATYKLQVHKSVN